MAEFTRQTEQTRIAGGLAKFGEAGEDVELALGHALAFDLAHDLRANLAQHLQVDGLLIGGHVDQLVDLDLGRQILGYFVLRAAQDEGVNDGP